MGRRDVVATGGEDHDGISDLLQVHDTGGVRVHPGLVELHLALLEPVADEQVLHRGENFLATQEIVARPPALEFEKAFAFGVDVRVEVVVLLPPGVGRVQALEALYQPGAVEPPAAQICHQVRQPGAAQQPPSQAHRVDVLCAGPVRQRGAIQNRRGIQAFTVGSQQRHRPAALAVAIQHGRHAAMAACDFLGKGAQCMDDIGQRLSGAGFGIEDGEIGRVAQMERHTDFGVVLEAPDPRAVTRPRVDHHHRSLILLFEVARVRRAAARDAQQRVVRRPLELPCVEDQFVFEVEQGRLTGALVSQHVVATLAQHVHEEQAALQQIDVVAHGIVEWLRQASDAGRAHAGAPDGAARSTLFALVRCGLRIPASLVRLSSNALMATIAELPDIDSAATSGDSVKG